MSTPTIDPTPAVPTTTTSATTTPVFVPGGTITPTDTTQKQGDPADDKLGEPGLKALQQEREARERLEQQFKKIAEAFGVKSEDAKSDDAVAALQQQMAELKHTNLANSVAREHKITDADDLALLEAAGSEDAMRKLAARLAPKAADDAGSGANGNGGKRAPKPDSSQGRGGDNGKKGRGEDGLAEARRRWPQPATQ